MSNPWAQSFDDLRSPYLQEKKAKKDYDGDGKIESGSKEHAGVVHNAIQKKKGGKPDGQDTRSMKEAKYDDSKVSMRFGDKKQKERKEKLEKKRGMKLDKHPQFESKAMKSYLDKRAKKLEKDKEKQSTPYKNNPAFGDPSHHSNKKSRMEHHRKDEDGNTVPHEDELEVVLEKKDKKGKGSGKKDACYHKVKAASDVWPSAYASGRLVQCRKVGAANYGKSKTKKESVEFVIPLKSFDDMVGECWKTHEQRGMKKKGNRMVPNCVPKGSPRKEEVAYEAVKNPKLDIKTGVKNKIEINPEIKTEAAKAPVKK